MKIIYILFIIMSLLSASEIVSRTQIIMGTFATISLPETHFESIETGFKILKSVESELSSYDQNADIYKLNHTRSVALGSYTFEALSKSKHYYEETKGYFDISIGSITKGLYRFGEDERLANLSELQNAPIAFKSLSFNQKNAWLDENITIDLGGMGKGFGVDKVNEYYKDQGIKRGKIALSGDIRCLSRCDISIQDPFNDTSRFFFKTLQPHTAISTSGNYRRFVKDVTSNHLINPKQKCSQQNFASITLISTGSNSDLDAYATAASVMPIETAKAFLASRPLAYIMIETDGTTTISPNLNKFVLMLNDTLKSAKENKPE